jgi:hypothetical protein
VDQANFPWRPLGRLLVDMGLLTASELERALDEQRRTGRLLGQILVGHRYVTAFSLARALTEQHGVELRPTGSGAGGRASGVASRDGHAWRPLGRLLVENGFLSEAELEEALAVQRRSHRRLGEILIARGWLTGPALALALAEQHGVDLGSEDDLAADVETVTIASAPGEPTYEVWDAVYEPTYRPRSLVYETSNFLEAADFACEYAADRKPIALEIQRRDGDARETVWAYSETRAAAAAATAKPLSETFGFDPIRWTPGRPAD